MHTETIEYFDGSQKLIGKIFYETAVSQQKRPAIMLFHALEGRTGLVLNLAEKYAKQGYIAFAVDMYGDAKSADTLEGGFTLLGPSLKDRNMVRRRAVLAYETIKKHALVDAQKIGAIGFCFGGMCILELLRAGEPLTAAVCCHAVLAKSELPTHKITGKLLVMQGYQDPQVPPSTLQAFAEEMFAASNSDWTFSFFGDAKHSYTDPKTGTFDPAKEAEIGREYNPVAAARAFTFADSFFKEWLF